MRVAEGGVNVASEWLLLLCLIIFVRWQIVCISGVFSVYQKSLDFSQLTVK